MTLNALAGGLGIPAVAAALFAALASYRIAARADIAATALTLLCSLSPLCHEPQPGSSRAVDDLNCPFVALTAFLGLTTSIFSASYIGHELENGRLTPPFVRFYHAMYQLLMFAMDLTLPANNIGLLCVA